MNNDSSNADCVRRQRHRSVPRSGGLQAYAELRIGSWGCIQKFHESLIRLIVERNSGAVQQSVLRRLTRRVHKKSVRSFRSTLPPCPGDCAFRAGFACSMTCELVALGWIVSKCPSKSPRFTVEYHRVTPASLRSSKALLLIPRTC